MSKSVKIRVIAAAILISFTTSGCYLFTPLSRIPKPASFYHLDPQKGEGELFNLELNPERIYGMGLTYAAHLRETGMKFDPDIPPPVFKKSLTSLNKAGNPVKIPDRQDLINAAENIETGLGEKIDKEFESLPPLLDYEGELAFILLEDIDWQRIDDPSYSPQLGYFLANDISARTIAILGEGRPNRHDYWGASKSFPGFLPVSGNMWVPNIHEPDSILSTTIVTRVNGKIRQKQSTGDMMYTPREMLSFIKIKFPEDLPKKGDMVLTGTPSGVAFKVPAWKAWLSDVLSLDRFTKLVASVISFGGSKKFLKPGDVVEVSSEALGAVEVKIIGN